MFTTRAKNIMLDAIARATAPAAAVDRVGVFQQQAGKAVTGVNATDLLTSAAHGFAAGDLVAFSALNGGAGLEINKPYFVIATGLTANDFRVARTPGGTQVNFTTDVVAVSTIHRYVEPGAPYARVAIAWNAPAEGTVDDSTNGAVINVPASVDVDAEGGWHNASGDLLVWNKVTKVVGDASNWTYTYTDADLTISDP